MSETRVFGHCCACDQPGWHIERVLELRVGREAHVHNLFDLHDQRGAPTAAQSASLDFAQALSRTQTVIFDAPRLQQRITPAARAGYIEFCTHLDQNKRRNRDVYAHSSSRDTVFQILKITSQ